MYIHNTYSNCCFFHYFPFFLASVLDMYTPLSPLPYVPIVSSLPPFLQTALDLHILADRYGFTFLKDEIEAHLITIISVDNVLLFHSHAHVSSAIQLKERCETFMDQNAKSVIKSRSLPCLPKENFKVLIARDTFVVEEVEIFDAVKKWIEHNKVDKNDAVDLLECVRLTEIPYGELKSRVLPSGLYQREAVTEAMRGSQVSDRECIATRGKTGEEDYNTQFIILVLSKLKC